MHPWGDAQVFTDRFTKNAIIVRVEKFKADNPRFRK